MSLGGLRRLRNAAFLSLSLALASCAPAGIVKKPPQPSSAETETAANAPVAPGVEVTEASLRGKDFVPVPELEAVHFEYDKYALDGQAQAALGRNAAYLKAHPDLEVLVEGHCDQRGTVAYNLALGQKRAKEVRDYYIRLGVAGRTVATISFGKERLACSESSEECWAKNRRAETKARSRAAAGGGKQDATP